MGNAFWLPWQRGAASIFPLGGARFSKNHFLWSQFYFRVEWGSEVGGKLGHEPFTNAQSVDEPAVPKDNKRNNKKDNKKAA